jgi:hypothetical protein
MGHGDGWRERKIFAGSREANIRSMHAIEWRKIFGCVVREVAARKHVGRVTSRDFRQFRIRR